MSHGAGRGVAHSDQHDDAGHYSYVERCRDHINHIKRFLSTNDEPLT
jgi:hypothetical protein